MIHTDTENIRVETMTLEQTAQLFRSVGVSTTAAKLADGIEQGVYPFAICIQGKGKMRQYEIYKRLVLDYLRARAAVQEAS